MRSCIACRTALGPTGWRCPGCGWEPAEEGGFLSFLPEPAGSRAGYDPSHFERLAGDEAGSFWFRYRNDRIVAAVRRRAGHPERFLEVGCGTGFVLSRLEKEFPAARLTGVEAWPDGLGIAAGRTARAELIVAGATALPYREEFDVAGLFDVLEHVEDDLAPLREVRQALRPGGWLVLTVPQHPFLWSATDVLAGHVRRYRRRDLARKVEEAGFTVAEATSFLSFLLPLLIASRLANRLPGTKRAAETRLPRLLERFLASVCAVEGRLLDGGVGLPLGGSLLVVARRPG